MADGKVEIESSIDTSGIDSGVKGISDKLKNLGNSGTLKGLANIGATVSGIGVAFKAATSVAKKAIDVIKDLNAAANKQVKAETQLESAAKNNPYLNSASVKQLKEYASSLQSIGTIGDEELIPMMAQLAAAGRTQAEIQDIMSAAVDVAASGTMSLESAVKNLNKTYSGLSGELGESIPQIKNLTTEQLKNGDAVKILKSQYAGMAEETTKATGSGQQLANAFGDLKEQLGMGFTAILSPVQSFFTSLITKVGNAIGKANELMGLAHEQPASTMKASDIAKAELVDLKEQRETIQADIAEQEKKYQDALTEEQEKGVSKRQKKLEEDAKKWADDQRNTLQNSIDLNQQDIDNLNKQIAEQQAIMEDASKKLEDDTLTRREENSLEKQYNKAEKLVKKYKREVNDLEALNADLSQKLGGIDYIERTEAKTSDTMKGHIDELNGQLDDIDMKIDKKRAEIEELKKKEQNSGGSEPVVDEAMTARDNLRKAYDETIRQKQAEIKQRRINGEEISEEAEAQEMYNTAFASYVQMMSDPAFAGNSGNYVHEVNARKKIADWGETAQTGADRKAAGEQIKGLEAELKKATGSLDNEWESQYEALLKTLDDEYTAITSSYDEKLAADEEYQNARAKLEEEYQNARAELEKAKDDEIAQHKKDALANYTSQVAGYTAQTVQIMQDASNLMLETVQNQATAEQAALEAKYLKGEISEEEYNEAVTESKKKAAKEQYKIEMFQWSASILTATANIAEGITKAIAQGGAAGIITGALVGAAGAVQLASIIASKPVPPSFSTGGIVGGSSYYGDNVAANLNSREMVLNMGEQKGLWDFINGGSKGAGSSNIVINNSAANVVKATPQITRDKVEVWIDMRVNEGLKKGLYNKSLNVAQNGMTGDFYGI